MGDETAKYCPCGVHISSKYVKDSTIFQIFKNALLISKGLRTAWLCDCVSLKAEEMVEILNAFKAKGMLSSELTVLSLSDDLLVTSYKNVISKIRSLLYHFPERTTQFVVLSHLQPFLLSESTTESNNLLKNLNDVILQLAFY